MRAKQFQALLASIGSARRFAVVPQAEDKKETAEMYIYDSIGADWFGGIGAKDVAAALESVKGVKQLNIYINSPGGDVFEGVAIKSLFDRFPGKKAMFIDGLCASIA